MQTPRVLVVAGTRPEVLKLAPLIAVLQQPTSGIDVKSCFSGQHVELLESVLGELDLRPDVDLREGSCGGSLTEGLARLLERLGSVVSSVAPDGVVVQGDTNTALAGAMVAFHHRIPSFHVEAGLRTANPEQPFPEEMNRRLITRMARLHFAPTTWARENLIAEGVSPHDIVLTGNTGLDTLRRFVAKPAPATAAAVLAGCSPTRRKILVTLHRRENLERVVEVTDAVKELLAVEPGLEVLWILHLNQSRHIVLRELSGVDRVHLIEPQPYSTFVALMAAAHVILTDSGGVQEEAPALGVPVLVLRDETERPEAVLAGRSCLVGCSRAAIVETSSRILEDPEIYAQMSSPSTLYGDGHASERIAAALVNHFAPARSSSLPPSLRAGAPSWAPRACAAE